MAALRSAALEVWRNSSFLVRNQLFKIETSVVKFWVMTPHKRSDLRPRVAAYRQSLAGISPFAKEKLANWQMYAAAAGSALAMASSVSAGTLTYGTLNVTASITPFATGTKLNSVNRPVNINVGSRTQLKNFAIKGANVGIGVGSFRVPNTHSGSANVFLHLSRNGVNGLVTQAGILAKVASGAKISHGNVKFLSTDNAIGTRLGLGFEEGNHGMVSGPFTPSRTGFAGFGVHTTGGNDYYGWIRLEFMDSPRGPDEIEAIDYAINNVAGASINAGQGVPASAPEPSTSALALLAAGAAGVLALRRRKAQTS
jgi:hypothetical protein